MAKNFHEAYTSEDAPLPSERSTGLVFAVVVSIVAYFWRANTLVLACALALAALLVVVSLLAPSLLRPLNLAWFRFGLLLNRIVSPLVMLVLFAVAIVPFGLVYQRFNDPLRRRRTGSDASYWIPRDSDGSGASMTHQF